MSSEITLANKSTHKIVEKPECYKKPLQWDANACGKCEYDMQCYNLWLKYMRQNKEGLWGN